MNRKISFDKVGFSIDGTNQCVGRDCVMCSGNPLPVCTQSFTLEQAQCVTKEIANMRLGLSITLTGGGETLLTPDLPDIVSEFLSYSKTESVGIITSGFLPQEIVERKNLEAIMGLRLAHKVVITLSFHLFGNRFYERFKNTLRFLMQINQCHVVNVKMTYSDKTLGRTLLAFQNILCELAREESPMSTVNEYGFNFMGKSVSQFFCSQEFGRLMSRYSDDNATRIMTSVLTLPFKYIFRREYVAKEPMEVWLYPQEVSLFGKGSEIEIKNRVQPYQCATLFGGAPLFEDSTAHMHIGSDGFYYPSCGCPYDENIRLEKVVPGSLIEALQRLAKFECKTARRMRPRKAEFFGKIPCQECLRLTGNF